MEYKKISKILSTKDSKRIGKDFSKNIIMITLKFRLKKLNKSFLYLT